MSDLNISRCPRCGAIDSVQDESCTVCGTVIPAQRDLPWQVVLIESGDGARGYRISRYLIGLGLTKNEIADALRSLPSRVTPALPPAKAIAVLDYLESLGAQARIEVAPRPPEVDPASLPPPAQNRSLLLRALSPILLLGLLLVLASQVVDLGTSVLSGDRTVADVLRTAAMTVQEIGLGADDFSAAQGFLPEDVHGEEHGSASLEIVSRNQIDSETYELNQEGVRLFKEGDADAALAKLEDAYARQPDNRMIAGNLSNVLTFIGWSNVKAKEFDDALQRFDRALGANQENVEALKGAGFSKIQLKETDAAVRDFEDAYRLAPADADLAVMLARLLHRSDRIDQATTVLNTLLKEQPRNEKAKKLLIRIRREESVERGFMASDTGHFRLKFDVTENAGFGPLVSAILEEAYSMIGSQFHYYPSDPVVVILYTREEFRTVSGLPHWSRGAYDGKIRIPVGGVNERTEELEDVIYHEYTHVVVNQLSGGRCPTWLNEGLAQYDEPSTEDGKRALLKMLRQRELAPLSSLEGSFLKLPGDQARFAYAEAFAVVLYIAETYSFYHLRLILEEIGDGLSPEGALQKILHFGYDDLLTGVTGYIQRG